MPRRSGNPAGSAESGYGGGSYGAYDASGEVHLTDYLRILYKRRLTALTVFLVILGGVVLYTFTATPIYRATVQILIDDKNPNVVKFEDILQQSQRANEFYQTQYRILQSRALARRAIDSEKLWNHPILTGAGARRGVSLNPIAWVTSGVQAARGLFASNVATETPDASETLQQSRSIDAFLARLTVTPVRNSQLVDVSFAATDGQFAARLANALGKAYIEQNLAYRLSTSKDASEFLDARIAEQRKNLEQSELALQQYREQTDSVSLEDRQNIVVQRLADLNAAVTRARTERIQKETVYQQIRSIQTDSDALDTIPAVLSNGFIQQLKGQLGELQQQRAQAAEKLGARHPDMIKLQSAIDATQTKIRAEVAKVVQALRNDYDAAVAQERSLNVALEQQKVEAQNLNRRSIQYGELQRESASNRQMFETLLQRGRETDVSGELRTTSIRIIDQAEVPRRPASPNIVNNLLIGFLAASVFGIGFAFFFEYLDNRIKSPDEIKSHLGLPFLGMVPSLDAAAMGEGSPLVNNGVPQHFAETFRTIRTSVLFASAEAGPKSLIVTSTAPGEGKTLVSSNLAMSLAMAGQRVLLVDADMRRPKVHEAFKVTQQPGLSNVLVGDAKASEAVRKTSAPNLWIIPAGTTPPNPAELLGSRRFKDFLATLGEHFDWIVLDTPPVMAVTDASILAHSATGVVFVVGSEMTSRGAAKAALEKLDGARAKYVGGILNRVDVQRNPYYYAHYYRREYQGYYANTGA